MRSRPDRVWYVTYGSNLSAARFGCYLVGGRPAGGVRLYTGCRDPRRPRERVAIEVPGLLYFAGESAVWGGGSAFLDPSYDGAVAARAYHETAGQFSDVVAQETRRPVGTDLRLGGLEEGDSLMVEALHYRRVLCLGWRDGVPLMTMTSDGHEPASWSAPSKPYLWTIGAGLRESHGWDADRIGSYLAAAGGAEGVWTAGGITEVVSAPAPY
jgi:hypothetical protein